MSYHALATITIDLEFAYWKIGKRYFRRKIQELMLENLISYDSDMNAFLMNESVAVISFHWSNVYHQAIYDLAEHISYNLKARVMYQYWDEENVTHVEYFEEGIKLADRVNERLAT